MNGIILTTLAAITFGGIEFGWTQLPDGRVEYIIQLDDQAIEALKNGEPLTSSLPPEVRNADRIRIQYGVGTVEKPVLLRKPQSFSPTRFSNTSNTAPVVTDGQGNGGQGSYQPRSVADTRPTLNPQDLGTANNTTGQVRYSSGNQSVVSNSSMATARKTSYTTPQDNTGSRLPWGNDGRTIQNYDDQPNLQNRSLTADRRNNANPNTNFSQNNGAVNNTNPNPGTTGFNQGTGFNNQGTGFNQGTTGTVTPGTMTPVPNPNLTTGGGNWKSPLNPNTGQNPNYTGQPPAFTNPTTGIANPNGIGNPGNTFPNANPGVNGGPAFNPTGPSGGYQFPNYPVSTGQPQPNSDVVALTKQIEQLKEDAKAKKQDERFEQIQKTYEKQIDDLKDQLKESAKTTGENPKQANPVTPQLNASKEDDSKGSNSVAITVFLLFSIGLNVFLVVQYLSVQNQFRDLSNDLRDSFMSNTYE